AAAEALRSEGIAVRVLDCYSVKPIDGDALHEALAVTGLLVVAEDHRIEGGLGDAVLEAIAARGALGGRVVKPGVTAMAGSGTPQELRAWAGIDAASIAASVRKALAES